MNYAGRNTGLKTSWKSSIRNTQLRAEDRARLAKEAEQRLKDREASRDHLYEEIAKNVLEIWTAAKPTQHHPYLASKDVEAHGLRVDTEGNLLIPVQDLDGKIWSLQKISDDGKKSFTKNGRVAGNFYVVNPDTHQTKTTAIADAKAVIIAEGYATAVTVAEATGLPTLAAFNAGNLNPT